MYIMRYHEKPKDGVTQTALNECTDCTYIIALCTYTHTHIQTYTYSNLEARNEARVNRKK